MKELINDAYRIIDIDRSVVKAMIESNFDMLPSLISEFRKIKVKIQSCLGQYHIYECATENEKEVLDRVQRQFPTDKLITTLENSYGTEAPFLELSDEETMEIGSNLFYSWISHDDYVRNIFKVNALILRVTIPLSLRRYIIEARNCFALEQHNAAISMCRTILEATAKDLCERRGLFEPQGDKVIEINPKVFNQLISKISTGKLKRRAVKLYFRDACPVVHGDRLVDANEALRVIAETTEIVQALYSLN